MAFSAPTAPHHNYYDHHNHNNHHDNNHNPLQLLAQRILFCPSQERTARELRQLPALEREQVWADMTGNPDQAFYHIHAEDPQLVQESMQQMMQEMQRLVRTLSATTPPTTPPTTTTPTASASASVLPNASVPSTPSTATKPTTTSSIHALDVALRQNVAFCTHPVLLLAFLRADGFQVSLAVARMAAHFEIKLSLFGREKLTRNITLLDLYV
jgi:hypothetical protein